MFEKEILCIDIGSQNIKLVVGAQKAQKVLVKKMRSIATPQGTYEDGNITNVHLVAEKISEVLKEEKIKTRNVICTSSSTTIISREITVPSSGKKELDTVVRFEIAQYLPIIMEDYVINHKIVNTFMDGDVEKIKVQVVVYPKHMAEKYLKLLYELKLNPIALDIYSNCIYKLFRQPMDLNKVEYNLAETVAVIDMGAKYLNLNIMAKGNNDFNRIIISGGDSINEAIEKELYLSPKESEKKKKEFSFDSMDFDHSLDRFNLAVKSVVNNWIEEITRIFQYYRNREAGNKIDCLYIYGGTSNLNEIEEYMASRLGMAVFKIKSLSNIEFEDTKKADEMNQYINAIGAIIRL